MLHIKTCHSSSMQQHAKHARAAELQSFGFSAVRRILKSEPAAEALVTLQMCFIQAYQAAPAGNYQDYHRSEVQVLRVS